MRTRADPVSGSRPRLADRHARRREGARGDRARLFPRRRSTPCSTSRARSSPSIEAIRSTPASCSSAPRLRRALPLLPAALPVAPSRSSTSPAIDLVVSLQPLRGQGRAAARPGAYHLCYCHTPMRYAWDQERRLLPRPPRRRSAGLRAPVLAALRALGRAPPPARVDRYRRQLALRAPIGSAATTAARPTCVPPPVDTDFFTPGPRRRQDAPRDGPTS